MFSNQDSESVLFLRDVLALELFCDSQCVANWLILPELELRLYAAYAKAEAANAGKAPGNLTPWNLAGMPARGIVSLHALGQIFKREVEVVVVLKLNRAIAMHR